MTEARFVATENYFEELENAVLATPRGRWFLSEYAKRNRRSDTTSILEAVDRLMNSVKSDVALGHVEILRRELQEMSHSIIQTRREIAAIKPTDPGNNRIMAATEELDAILTATERATGDILTAAERLSELANDLRTSGAQERLCDEVESIGTNILMACSFQDLTGQRTTKVVNVLRYLEQRVNAMIEIWGVDGITPVAGPTDKRPDAHLLSGPAKEGEGVSQDDIDRMMNGQEIEGPSAGSASPISEPPVRIPVATVETEAMEGGTEIDQDSIDALFA